MSRCFHRQAGALLTFAAALAFVEPALGTAHKGSPARDGGAAQEKGKHAPSEKPQGKAKQASPEKAPRSKKPAEKTQAPSEKQPAKTKVSAEKQPPKTKAPSEKQPAKTKASAEKHATHSKTNEKSKPAEKSKSGTPGKPKPSDKHAPPAKQNGDAKHGLGPAPRPTAAKSLAPPSEDDRSRSTEPGLKPPGAARPMVRSVSSRLVIPPREVAEQTLAFHYANLGDSEVVAELNRRGIAWVPAAPPLPGVRTPIRLSGPLHGVTIHSTLPEAERRTSAFEILDARLALALDDFCALLARHDVVEIVHYTMYRPPGELPPDLNKQIRHPAGLAIDVGAVRKADGRWLAVGPHWPSDIGAKTCGEGAREHWSRPGREIVSIACEAADLRMFHFILTPHFDAAHADHLHLEIKPETRWFLVN